MFDFCQLEALYSQQSYLLFMRVAVDTYYTVTLLMIALGNTDSFVMNRYLVGFEGNESVKDQN